MKFQPGTGANFQPGPSDGNGQAFVARDVKAGQALEFIVSGTGALPRDAEAGGAAGPGAGAAGPQGADDSAAPNGPGGKPGGGIGNPIDTPDPLSKYKYWILGGLAIVLAAAAAFLLRKPAGAPAMLPTATAAVASEPQVAAFTAPSATKSQLLLEALKEELFAIESEKIAGKLSPEEYAEVKSALEVVLRRALSRQ
jgi:hypothetical protein